MRTLKEERYDRIKCMSEKFRHPIFNPAELVDGVLAEVNDKNPITENSKITVLFNPEFVISLLADYNVKPKNITLFTAGDPFLNGLSEKMGINYSETMEKMKLKNFDSVLVNPPYQSWNGKERNIGAPLWPTFVKKSMELLKEDGVGAFITPATWMNRSKQGAWKSIRDYDLTYVETNCIEHFPNVNIPNGITWFILSPNNYSGSTSIKGEFDINFHEDELPRNTKFLSAENIKRNQKLLRRKLDLEVFSGPMNPSINSEHWSTEKTETHKYQTYYSGKASRSAIWCDQPIGDHGKLKLVVPNAGAFYDRMEITKKGAGRQANYILGTRKELEHIRKLLLSDESRELCELNTEGSFNNALKYIVGKKL